jgi:hypothetical protein
MFGDLQWGKPMNEEQFQSGPKELPRTDVAEGLSPAPMPGEDQPTDHMPNIRVKEPTFMEVFFAWEKLRLVYNAVLVVVVLIKARFVDDMGLESLIPGALIANLCFCTGPIAEGYFCLLGFPRPIGRPLLFCLGMFVPIALTINTPAHKLAPPLH